MLRATPATPSASLDALVTDFAGLVRRVAWRHRLRDADVDEVMQEVRIRLWRSHGPPDGGSEQATAAPASYVYKTAMSAALDLLRRRRAQRVTLTVPLDDGDAAGAGRAPAAGAELEASELAAQVARAIDAIPASRRPVVRMYLAGHPREEIAELMGWSEAKTRNLLYRGLADLRDRLREMGITPTTSAT